MGEYYKVISDIRFIILFRSDNRFVFYKMSDFYYKFGEVEELLM